jgi:serine/threonine-protein kinase
LAALATSPADTGNLFDCWKSGDLFQLVSVMAVAPTLTEQRPGDLELCIDFAREHAFDPAVAFALALGVSRLRAAGFSHAGLEALAGEAVRCAQAKHAEERRFLASARGFLDPGLDPFSGRVEACLCQALEEGASSEDPVLLRDDIADAIECGLEAIDKSEGALDADVQVLLEKRINTWVLRPWALVHALGSVPNPPARDVDVEVLRFLESWLARPGLGYSHLRFGIDLANKLAEPHQARGHLLTLRRLLAAIETSSGVVDNVKDLSKQLGAFYPRLLDGTRSTSATAPTVADAHNLALWLLVVAHHAEWAKTFRAAEDQLSSPFAALVRCAEQVRARLAFIATVTKLDDLAWDSATFGRWLDGIPGTVGSRLETSLRSLSELLASCPGRASKPQTDALEALLEDLMERVLELELLIERPDVVLAQHRPLEADATRVMELRETFDSLVAKQWGSRLGGLLGPAIVRVVELLFAEKDRRRALGHGTSLGRYALIEQLSVGGQGEIWLSRDLRLNRSCVVKLARGALFHEGGEAQRQAIRGETDALRRIEHPCVVSVLDCEVDGPCPHVVLAYEVGVDLQCYASVRPVSLAELVPILRHLAAGLRALHDRGLVHGDLKPANVFLCLDVPRRATPYHFCPADRDPLQAPVLVTKVIDFGLTRATGTRAPSSGTLGFLPPEQAAGQPLTVASDVYALAATLHAALTGKRFFEHLFARGVSEMEIVSAHAEREPAIDPELDPGVAGLLREATSLDPTKRPSLNDFLAGIVRACSKR